MIFLLNNVEISVRMILYYSRENIIVLCDICEVIYEKCNVNDVKSSKWGGGTLLTSIYINILLISLFLILNRYQKLKYLKK